MPRMGRVFLPPTIVLLILAAVFFAMTAVDPPGSKTIVFASADDTKTLDPGRMSWAGDIRAATGLWEGLTAYDPKTLVPIPGAASSWEVSADGLKYTFHLRPEAKWSNGDPLRAQDFLFAWKRVLNPATAADYIDMVQHLEGAEAYTNALEKKQPENLPDFSKVGAKAIDEHTIEVRLAAPCTYFLDLTAFPPYFPLHEKAMAPFLTDPKDPDAGYDGRWTHPPNLVTNGPFKLVEWQFKRHLLFEPNEHYWDRSAVKCERLRLVTYDDPRSGLLAYDAGTVDVMSWVPQEFGPELLAAQAAGKRNDVHWRPVFGTYYYIFNCSRKPFDDVRVRRALTLAIDKEQITQKVLRMGQQPVNVLVPPDSIVGYHGPKGVDMDVAQARKCLAEAGFPGGAGFPVTEILYNNESIHSRTAQVIGQMWEKNLGIRISYRGVERGTFGDDRRSLNFAIARGGWYGDYADPTTWLNLAKSGDGNNDGKYSNPKFDDTLVRAGKEIDPAKRFGLLREAEGILVEQDFPFIPLYEYSDGYIYDDKKIGGADVNVRLLTQFKYIHRIVP